MTEEEAKKKVCHKTLMQTVDDIGDRSPWTDGTRCIASACMAWRREADMWLRPDGTAYATTIEPANGRGRWVGSGFCGLAGKP